MNTLKGVSSLNNEFSILDREVKPFVFLLILSNNSIQVKQIANKISQYALFIMMGFSVFLISWSNSLSGQIYDTVSNWDNITPEWNVYAQSGQQVDNPLATGINASLQCMELVTSEGEYDLMMLELEQPANFEDVPFYRVKILAPPSGGNVLLKFENSDNSSWQELLLTPEPMQWVDLVYDFSDLESDNFTRMAIFVDFQGTTPGISWYIDDVINVNTNPEVFSSYLPLVMINTDGVEIPNDPKITGLMGIIDNGSGNINTIEDDFNDYNGYVGIEIRGESSQMFPKKSYGFETRDEMGENLNVPILGMPAENDWILYAPYSDKTMLRNFLSFEMGRLQGAYSSRMVYCELFVNDIYMGVYVMMEKVKRDKNRVDVSRLDIDDNSGDSLTGGYILRVDKLPWDFEYGTDGWLSSPNPSYPNAMDITFQYRYPDPDIMTTQQKNYIKDYVTDAEETLIGGGFSDPETGYHEYLDVGSFVDQMILNEICKEVDAYRYSTYFYKHHIKDGGKLFAGPPWDYNLGYGNVDYWAPGVNTSGWVYTGVTPVSWSIMYWWKRLMEDQYFKDLLKSRWVGLRQTSFSDDSVQTIIDNKVDHLGFALDRNYERWPILGEYVWPNYYVGDTYEEDLDYFTTFLFDRLDWMDNNLPGTVLDPSASISGDNQVIAVELTEEYFNRKVFKNKHFDLGDAPPEIDVDTVIYISATSAEIYLSGILAGEAQLYVTIDEKVLNGYEDLVSNTLLLTNVQDKPVPSQDVTIYSIGKTLHVLCPEPETLPGKLEVFTISGQSAGSWSVNNAQHNEITLDLPGNIYLVQLRMPGRVIARKIIVH